METAKKQIFDTAFDLFIKNGYSKTSLRCIAKEADVNLGLIPYYYGSKENLGNAVFRAVVRRIYDKLDYNLIPLNNSLEKYYYGYHMVQYYLNSNSKVRDFYIDFLKTADMSLDRNPASQEKISEIINEYGLKHDEDTVKTIASVLIGIERELLYKKMKGLLNISYFKINEIMASTALFLIGIDKKNIECAIENVNKNIKTLPYDWSIME